VDSGVEEKQNMNQFLELTLISYLHKKKFY
jgi:hypothetical protein